MSASNSILLSRVRRKMHVCWLATLHFCSHFWDRPAARNPVKIQLFDVSAALATVLASAAGMMQNAQLLVASFPSIPANAVSLLFLGCGLLACLGAVVATVDHPPKQSATTLLGQDHIGNMYRVSQPVRHLAKLGSLVLPLLIAAKSRELLTELRPFTEVVEGVVLNEDGKALSGATVEAFAANGQNATRTSWPSDDKGAYRVFLSHDLPRDAILRVTWPGCERAHPLRLRPWHRLGSDSTAALFGSPEARAFRHNVNCEVRS